MASGPTASSHTIYVTCPGSSAYAGNPSTGAPKLISSWARSASPDYSLTTLFLYCRLLLLAVVGGCCIGRLMMSAKDDIICIRNKLLVLFLAYVFVCVATSPEIFAGQIVLFLYCIWQ
jgi:hypothetical protein